MAAIARYHRKGTPRKDHPEVSRLDDRQKKTVYPLGVLLRLAETLDRSHAGVIREVELVRVDKKTIALEPKPTGDCDLEIWRVHKHVKVFTKAFGTNLQIRLPEGVDASADHHVPPRTGQRP